MILKKVVVHVTCNGKPGRKPRGKSKLKQPMEKTEGIVVVYVESNNKPR